VKKLYRVYYNTFDDEAHNEIIREIRERYKAEVLDHPSKVNPDFRFIEIYLDQPGLEEEIASLVRVKVGHVHVKVDWIDTSR
jgi:hypothetical protein